MIAPGWCTVPLSGGFRLIGGTVPDQLGDWPADSSPHEAASSKTSPQDTGHAGVTPHPASRDRFPSQAAPNGAGYSPRVHKLLRDANPSELHLFNSRRSTFRADTPHLSIERKVDMRAHRIVLSFAIAMGCGIALHGFAFSQEYRGTWEQQQACTPDVWRLCGAQIPDANRIVACLRRNTPQLSDRCRAVFQQSDNAPPRREDRDYGQRRDDRDDRPRPSERDYGTRPYYDDE